MRISGVRPEIKPEWLGAAAPTNAEDPYNVVTVSRTETLHIWGFSVSISLRDNGMRLQTSPR